MPVEYGKYKVTYECFDSTGEFTGYSYGTKVMAVKFKEPPGGANGEFGKDVMGYDGYANFEESNPSWRYVITRDSDQSYSTGKSTAYSVGASVWGIGVRVDSDFGSEKEITIHAGKKTTRLHHIWCSSGSINGSHCGVLHSY